MNAVVEEKLETKPPVIQPLAPASRKLREQALNNWVVYVEEDTGPKDLLVPGYWAHHGHELRMGDRIEAHAHDMTWMAEYIVLDAQKLLARLCLLHFYELASEPVVPGSPISDYKAEWKGPAKKWCVTQPTGIVKEDLATKQDALDWIRDRLKAS